MQNYDISPKKEKNRRQKTTACRQRLALRVHSRRRPVRMHAPTALGCNPGSVRRRRPHAGGCRENGRRASRRSPPAACTSIHSPDLVGLVKPHGARHVRPAQPVAAPIQYELGSSCRRRSTDPDRREESPHPRSPPFRRGRARAKARATALPNNQFDTGTNTAKKFSDNTSSSTDETVTPRRSRSATARSRHRLRACCPP